MCVTVQVFGGDVHVCVLISSLVLSGHLSHFCLPMGQPTKTTHTCPCTHTHTHIYIQTHTHKFLHVLETYANPFYYSPNTIHNLILALSTDPKMRCSPGWNTAIVPNCTSSLRLTGFKGEICPRKVRPNTEDPLLKHRGGISHSPPPSNYK